MLCYLPYALRTAIVTVIRDYDLHDPICSTDSCVAASEDLQITSGMGEVVGSYWHKWLRYGEWNIDLTAKQFDADAPCPYIWKQGKADLPPYHIEEEIFSHYDELINATSIYKTNSKH